MYRHLLQYLRPPIFTDEERTRTAGLLNGMLLVVGLLSLLFLVSVIAVWEGPSRQMVLGVSLVAVLAVLGLKALLQQGRVRLVAFLLSLAIWTAFTLPVVRFDGIRDVAVTGYYLAVVVTSLTLGRRGLVHMTALALVSVVMLYVLEQVGVLTTEHTDLASSIDLVTVVLTLGTTAVLSGFAVHRLSLGQQRLRHSRERLRDLFEAVPVCSFTLDREGVIQEWNRACTALYGWSASEAVGRSMFDLMVREENVERTWANIAALFAGETVEGLEFTDVRADGSLCTVLSYEYPLRDATGKIVAGVCSELDITERARTQEELRRSEQFLQDVFDAIRDGISVLDRDLNVVRTNAWMEEMYPEQLPLVGKKCYAAYQGRDGQCPWCPAHKALVTGETVTGEVPYERPGSPTGWLELSAFPIMDADGRVVNVIEYVKDISENKRAQEERSRLAEEIQAQARRMAQILATVPAGVLLLDAEGKILQANPTAEEDIRALAGVAVGERLVRVGDRDLSELLTSPPTRGLWHEVRVENRILEAIARPMERGGDPEHWVLVLNDVTREREISDELHQQERLAAVGQLAAGIAHDFNNILATIVLYAQMAAADPTVSGLAHERVEVINNQAWHATRLINQVLDFSRRAVLERQPLDLLPLVKEQVKLLKRTLPEHIKIDLAYGDDDYTVDADPTRMQQMLTNLAVNARDAMPEGGRLGIELSRILTQGDAAAAWVQLTVTDTGIGIPAEVLPHIYEPFYTTKRPGEGSGLGLSQVHGIVGQHGGYIDVHSAVGQGTTFTVALPAPVAAPSEPVGPVTTGLSRGQGETVLIVEDNLTLREALLVVVAQLHYETLAAGNGHEALAMLDAHPEIALVLSDLVMPEMGGQALFQELKARGMPVPMVMITGHPMRDVLEDLVAEGLAGWLQKPPDVSELSRVLAEALQGKEET